jgi:hypothetical protein
MVFLSNSLFTIGKNDGDAHGSNMIPVIKGGKNLFDIEREMIKNKQVYNHATKESSCTYISYASISPF